MSDPKPCAIDAAAVLDNLGLGVLVADRDGAILYRNIEAAHLLAEGDNLQTALSIARFGPENHWRVNVAKVLSSRSAMHWTGTFIADPTWGLLIRCAPMRRNGAATVAVLYLEARSSVGADEEYDVTRRLTSLGKLAARVAHELNNPLDGILRYINLAMRVAGDAPESRLTSYLTESRSGLMRMIRIISDLLEFSRSSDAGFEEAGVNELIEQAIKACSTAADANRVMVTADFQSDQMPRIRGSRVYQVCCNLIRNAIDAMPDEKIYEPFYTTKQPGKGTGLGLAICKEFVEDMGGTITAANADAGGAVFTIRIPVAGLQSPQRITR